MVDFQSIPPLPPHSTVKRQRRLSKLAAKDPSVLTPGPPPSSLPVHELSRPSTAEISSDNLQRFMSSPVPHTISTAPTSVPRKINPPKDKASDSGDDVASEGGKSDDTSSESSDSAKKSSDEGIPPPPSVFVDKDPSSAENSREENPASSETSEEDIGGFIGKINDYATLLYNNARQGQTAKVRKYTRKLKRLARQFRRNRT